MAGNKVEIMRGKHSEAPLLKEEEKGRASYQGSRRGTKTQENSISRVI